MNFQESLNKLKNNLNISKIPFEINIIYKEIRVVWYISRWKIWNQIYFVTAWFDNSTCKLLKSKNKENIIFYLENQTISEFNLKIEKINSLFEKFHNEFSDLTIISWNQNEYDELELFIKDISPKDKYWFSIEASDKFIKKDINTLSEWLELSKQGYNCIEWNVNFSQVIKNSIKIYKKNEFDYQALQKDLSWLKIKKIIWNLSLSNNNLTSIKWLPIIKGWLNVTNNNLRHLEINQDYLDYLLCSNNPIITLKSKFNVKEIWWIFSLDNTNLKNLRWFPKINTSTSSVENPVLNIWFNTHRMPFLESLEWIPEEINRTLSIDYSQLKTLEFMPKIIKGKLIIYNIDLKQLNKKKFNTNVKVMQDLSLEIKNDLKDKNMTLDDWIQKADKIVPWFAMIRKIKNIIF